MNVVKHLTQTEIRLKRGEDFSQKKHNDELKNKMSHNLKKVSFLVRLFSELFMS